ncbi:MAG TPA: DUF6064 family protein [Aestuariivirgaceae bacterium]|jgi:hypothetical protein
MEQLMEEWWTYTISDFLLFSPRTYYRMIGLYNRALWPAQIAAFGLGLFLLFLSSRDGEKESRVLLLALAFLWTWVAYAFHLQRYAAINWAAPYAAAAFALEAFLLLVAALAPSVKFHRPKALAQWIGSGLFFFALLVYPFLARLAGRDWTEGEMFGLTPDPTALGALGLLLMSRGPLRVPLTIIPFLWCIAASLTLLAMKAPEAWVLSIAAALALLAAFRSALRPNS